MGFIKEFKEFAVQGNVMDMAVGVIIGGAFGKIVSSLVDDIIMPVVGVLTGGVDFKDLAAVVGDAKITYGVFVQNVIDFLIIAISIFCVIKAINKFKKKEAPAPEAPAGPTTEELLADIKDILKNK